MCWDDSLFRQAVEDPTLQRFDAVTGNYNTFWIARPGRSTTGPR